MKQSILALSGFVNRKFTAFAALLMLLIVTGSNAFATAGAVETAITGAVTDAKVSVDAILVLAVGIFVSFLIYKLLKRAGSKA